jgi:hypothetical protein
MLYGCDLLYNYDFEMCMIGFMAMGMEHGLGTLEWIGPWMAFLELVWK